MTDRDHVLGLLDRLVDHVRRHFTYEEALMRETYFPGRAAHHAHQKILLAQVFELDRKFRDRAAIPTRASLEFLRRWLGNHVLQEDLAFVADRRNLQKNR